MISKEQAIIEIAALTKTHKINLEELTSILGKQQIEANTKDVFTITTLFSYLGGIFILIGLSAYITVAWASLNSVSRILITLGVGIVCLILGIILISKNRQGKSPAILIILSALLQSTGLFVVVSEIATSSGNVRIPATIIFGVLALQYGVLFLKLKRTSLLFFTIYFANGSFIAIADLLHIPHTLIELISGISLLAISYGIQSTPYSRICVFGYFMGIIALLWMSFGFLRNTYFEILYLAITCFMLYLSTIVQSRSILVTATLAMFSYLSYFTQQHFLNSVGWPIYLILLGFIFFGLSGLALKINKLIIRTD